ncbi:hypothetical protein ACHAXA_009671 [Cyclostephanos tholiformis]|uniref:Uncharacterized protein n=1 Tax=Cyclostephanos tholiformis TaxID=382380 RepID=A0ABD3RIQ3_9STRA
MSTHRDNTKAERKAAAKAALARARQWSEERRRGKSPEATTFRASESSSKKELVQTNATSPVVTAPDIQYRKTPSSIERAQTRSRALERNTDLKKATTNSKADVAATVERTRAKAPAIDAEDLSENAEDFKTTCTTERFLKDILAPTGKVVPKAHAKEILSITKDLTKIQNRLEVLCDAMANTNHDDSV